MIRWHDNVGVILFSLLVAACSSRAPSPTVAHAGVATDQAPVITSLLAQTINFGEKTLAGAGGAPLGSTRGTPSIVSQTCVTNGHPAFALDGNQMLVPTAYDGSATYLAPGAVPAAGSADCQVVVTNGTDTASETIHSLANTYSVRGLPAASMVR